MSGAPDGVAGVVLSGDERSMLDGEAGSATALAMRILVRMAPLYGADRLLPVTRAHIDGCIYEGDAGLEFAERLAREGGRVRVPTSLNVISLDRARWREQGTPPDYASKAARLGQAYVSMGATPTFTCAPYQTAAAPKFGEQIAWAESNAVAFANSVIGARTNRYGDYLDVSCALTGRVPAAGLHLDEPRLATVLIELEDLCHELTERDDFYAVLGYLTGTLVDDEVPVIDGLAARPGEDQLKAMAAASASSGSVAMFHITGVTPEAPTLGDALGGRDPVRRIRVGREDLVRARSDLRTATGERVDVFALGSPHCSLAECRKVAGLVGGERLAPGRQFLLTTSRAVRDLLERSGELAVLHAFGATVTADTCVVVSPLIAPSARVLMTNSAKYAHYGPGILNVAVVFGSTEDCVRSAIAGRAMIEDGPWRGA